MKYFLLFIMFTFISCNKIEKTIQDEEIQINSDYFIENKEYEVSINSKDTNLFLYCTMYSDKGNSFQADYYKFYRINNKLTTKVKFNKNIYKVGFYIAKKGKILKEIDTKSIDILNIDSSFKKQTYLTILNRNIEFNEGQKLINEFLNKYPNSLEIYPLKWKYETINKINKLDSLEKDLLFIKQNFPHNGNYYFIQFIGNKLKGDNIKAEMLIDSLQYFECEFFNNSVLYPMISKLLDVGYVSKNNSSEILNNIYKKNPLSLFTIRSITSLNYNSKDSSMLQIFDTLLSENKYYYPNILFSKFKFLNFIRVDTNKNILGRADLENIIIKLEDLYKNLNSNDSYYFLKENKYDLLAFINYNFVLNLIYSYHYLNGDYQKSINTANKVINLLNEDDIRLKFSTLLFIGDVYLNNLKDLANAKNYYFLAKSLDIKDDIINKKLFKLYKKYNLQEVSFDEWIQINLEHIDVENQKKLKDLPKINYKNNGEVSLYDFNKKTLLIFTSKTCSVCKFVYKEINDNKSWYSDKFNIYYISQEKQNDLDYLNEKYYLDMKEIINGKELFDYFKIGGVPVIIVLDENGNQIYKEEGANENWTLLDLNI